MDGTLPGSRVKNIGQGDENLLLRIQVVDLCGHIRFGVGPQCRDWRFPEIGVPFLFFFSMK